MSHTLNVIGSLISINLGGSSILLTERRGEKQSKSLMAFSDLFWKKLSSPSGTADKEKRAVMHAGKKL